MSQILDKETTAILENLKKTHKGKNDEKFYEAVDKTGDHFEYMVYEKKRLVVGRTERIIITALCWLISISSFYIGIYYKIPFTDIKATVNGSDKSGSIEGNASIYMLGFIFIFMPFFYMGIRYITMKPKIKIVVEKNNG